MPYVHTCVYVYLYILLSSDTVVLNNGGALGETRKVFIRKEFVEASQIRFAQCIFADYFPLEQRF